MPILHDDEFGKVVVRRTRLSSQVRLRVAPDGSLRASLPPYAPLFLIKRLLSSNRDEIRKILKEANPNRQFSDGMQIGKSHKLLVSRSRAQEVSVKKSGLNIEVRLTEDSELNNPKVERLIRDEMVKALRLEAKSYLPKRLEQIADRYDFKYSKVRFSHSSGRWGSCNSSGVISLNIALMNLPFELIDYVLTHELAHTVHMNHSQDFWSLVASCNPDYKHHKNTLKNHNPHI